MKSYLAQNKLESINKDPGVENYTRQVRAMDNLRGERAATPHAHKEFVPCLLDASQSELLLEVLQTSKASPAKKVEVLRDLPLSHAKKAEFVKTLPVDPIERVELLREMPFSPTRELELLRELPLDPMAKLEFLRTLPLPADKKTEFISELGLPLSMTADAEALSKDASASPDATMGHMGLSPERRAAAAEEMRMHDFVEGEIARNFAALQAAPIPVGEKLAILKELKLSENERAELNRRLGFPVDTTEIQRELGA